ncbi:MAG: hypothetical protein Q8N08_01115 [Methanobacteriaceae archaeon]|nr:hypothetical protein [Methanobacteriaceae archaeon]
MINNQAGVEDAKEIFCKKLAYQSEAELCQDYTIKPITPTLEETEQDF